MLQKIAVIGAGTMGNGIAHVFAQSGFKVHLIDVNAAQLEKAMQTISTNLDRQISRSDITTAEKDRALSQIECFNDMDAGAADADLIVEAVSENMEVKLDIFRRLDKIVRHGCILASNTSSISITKIASVTSRPAEVIGMHFMNPVPVMKLVEVINGFSTSETTTHSIIEITKTIGKVPCVANDYPGFVANRILMPMINEAITTLYEGVAGVNEIDTIMKLGMAHPMGPLQLADFIGLDVCYSILQVLQEGLGKPHYAPSPLLSNMVAAGKLGVKTGEGFYRYAKGSKELKVSERFLKP